MESQYSKIFDEVLSERKESHVNDIKKLEEILKKLKDKELQMEKQFQERYQVLFVKSPYFPRGFFGFICFFISQMKLTLILF